MAIIRTIVVNIYKDSYDVLITRSTKWGNPFRISEHCTRKQSVAKHKKWLLTQKHLMNSLHELIGKRLGCVCSPKLCHGDNLVKAVKEKFLK